MLARITLRGPLRSTHFPKKAADKPNSTNAMEYATPTSTSLQSPGPGAVMPRALAKGFLKTLNP